MTCERCGVSIEPGAEEACSVCAGSLCEPCWEAKGFGPGHTDAEFRGTWYVPPEHR
jgi:hypothetical protein